MATYKAKCGMFFKHDCCGSSFYLGENWGEEYGKDTVWCPRADKDNCPHRKTFIEKFSLIGDCEGVLIPEEEYVYQNSVEKIIDDYSQQSYEKIVDRFGANCMAISPNGVGGYTVKRDEMHCRDCWNSICMLDNFAVGYKSEKAPSGATSAWTGTKYDRAQRAVRYCDSFGRMERLDFQLLKTGPTPDNSNWVITENDLSWTVDEDNETITCTLDKAYPCYIIVWFQGLIADPYSGIPYLIFEPNETRMSMDWGWTADEMQFNGAYIYDGYYSTDETEKAKIAALAERYIRQQIAHEYPQKPSALNFSPSSWNSNEEKRPAFQLYDWLIKKNSAEALKFAAQYHFRQTWREFVIGSGMSNFCALVGGSCSQLQMFISALPINRFERHVNLGDTYNYLVLDDLPTFTVDEENKRVEITLPSSVNDYIDATKSWGLVGIDKNGNRQLIFGENKNAQNEAFLTTIYLVAMQKNNEPQARATYTLTVADTTSHEEEVSFSFYVDGVSYGRGDLEFPRGVEITVKNTHVRGFYFVLDGTSTWIGYQKTFTFKLTKDMEYYAWDTYVNPTDPMPM